MYIPYRPLHTRPTVPDQPVDPPEIDDATWEKNNRNSIRDNAIQAADTLMSRLHELDWDKEIICVLLNLMIRINDTMED